MFQKYISNEKKNMTVYVNERVYMLRKGSFLCQGSPYHHGFLCVLNSSSFLYHIECFPGKYKPVKFSFLTVIRNGPELRNESTTAWETIQRSISIREWKSTDIIIPFACNSKWLQGMFQNHNTRVRLMQSLSLVKYIF